VLSVFFAIGLVLMGVVQQMSTGEEAGLASFIYGKAASMLHRETVLIAVVAAGVIISVMLLFKQFRLICFDQEFAAAAGLPVVLIDLVMMALVVATTVVGLQAVGLIMIIALLIIPATAARFWTERLLPMTCIAALLGAVSGCAGSMVSALDQNLPTGAIIVLCAGALFGFSLLAAPHRGVLASLWRQRALSLKVHDQHLLRALAEVEEQHGAASEVTLEQLQRRRSWTAANLRRIVRRAGRRGQVSLLAGQRVRLTPEGRAQAARILRNHRLWEAYLIRYADIAPSHVDRDADEVEHVLSEGLIHELEAVLAAAGKTPACPHTAEAVGS
jgi:manganese/zinc/iron transport system permease protein